MTDNAQKYGFRWVKSISGNSMPHPMRVRIASGLAANLNVGDPISMLATGYGSLQVGSEGTQLANYGIIVGFEPVYDAAQGFKVPVTKFVSGAGVYGTNYDNQTIALVVPGHGSIWEIDCDDNSTFTTYATYFAAIGENADHVLTATTNIPRLDISTHNTTNTLLWRIVDVSQSADNADFSGNYVKLLVTPNVVQLVPGASTTGI
jgi:hypothetical protein